MKDSLILGKFTPTAPVQSEELRACYERIAELTDALQGWLAYAEENLTEFDVDADEECISETLCPRCENSGCINLKIRTTREALS